MIHNILLVLLIILLVAKILGSIFEKIGLDSTLGELLTGIILGPSLLKLVEAHSIESFAMIGSVLILFIAGMKQQDIFEIYKDKKAMKLGLTLLFATTGLMFLFFYLIPAIFKVHLGIFQAIILALTFAVVDIGVPAKLLISKGLINTPAGRITIRASIVNIVFGLFLFTILTLFFSKSLTDVALKFGGMILFLAITVGLVLFLSKIAKYVMRLHIEEAEFSLAIILILALAYLTDVIGFSSVLGAFIAGVLISRTPFAEMRSFSDRVKALSFGLFIPIFFVWFGLEIKLAEILKYAALAGLIFLAYTLIRFLITYAFMKKYRVKTPLLIGASVLSVDVESLVIILVALQLGIFVTDIPLTLFAPSVLLSTLFIVLLVTIFSKIELKKVKGVLKKTKE